MSFGNIAVHTFAAAWTFQDAGQDVCMVWIVHLFPLEGIELTFILCQCPIFFGYDSFMLPLIDRELRLLNHVHFISRTLFLFGSPSAISDFTHINRIVKHIQHKIPRKSGNGIVLPQLLYIAIPVQIFGNSGNTIAGVDIAVIDDTDNFNLIFSNDEITVFQLVAIGSKAAVPLTLTSLLLSSCHCLCSDILSLNLRNRRQYRNHQLTGILGAVNAIFYANQIDSKILHELQGVQNICCISAKPGELKDEYIRNAIFSILNVVQHPLELLPSLDILSGKSLVRILSGNNHILVCRIFPQLISLGIQAVPINLYGGGHSCI